MKEFFCKVFFSKVIENPKKHPHKFKFFRESRGSLKTMKNEERGLNGEKTPKRAVFAMKRKAHNLRAEELVETEREKKAHIFTHSQTQISRNDLSQMDAFSRHKYFVNNYLLFYGSQQKAAVKRVEMTDLDAIRSEHKFIWRPEDVAESWSQQLSKKYYDKLYKEYCICDLSKVGKRDSCLEKTPLKKARIGLRWRTQKEVVQGKGQFICGHKTCSRQEGLSSWEVNFRYRENETVENALVKIRLCAECSFLFSQTQTLVGEGENAPVGGPKKAEKEGGGESGIFFQGLFM
eukprot:Sdes_comp20882_c0_seq1m17890